MNSDFLNAYERHWTDAEYLYAAQRWANADHLYGFSGECGLKRLMLVFGMPFDSAKDKPSAKPDRAHIDEIWDRYETYRSGHIKGARYPLPSGKNPFLDWHASQRYAHQNQFDDARVIPHRKATAHIRELVKQAVLEGLL